MKFYIGLLIAAIAATASAVYCPPAPCSSHGDESHFAYRLKSFREALDECAEYLQVSPKSVDNLVAYNYVTDDVSLKCLVRCAGVNAGWWDVGGNYSGLHAPVLESYFQPACDDTCYARRTKECLEAKSVKCHDDCSQAYESFMCYYHQYGNLKSSEEYVPLPQLDAVQAAVDCMLLLRTPKDLLEQYSHGVFPAVPETQCLYRCQYLAEGLYDGVTFNLTRFYVRHYKLPSPQFLLPSTQDCVDKCLKESHNECARVYNARHCVAAFGNPNHSSELFQAAALVVLAHKTCEDEDLSPKYNGGSGSPEPAPCAPGKPAPPPGPCPSSGPHHPPSHGPYHPPSHGCVYNCGS